MAFILSVTRKTAGQPLGRFAANYCGMFYSKGIRKSEVSKDIAWDYSEVTGDIPISGFQSRPEVETMTMHDFRVYTRPVLSKSVDECPRSYWSHLK